MTMDEFFHAYALDTDEEVRTYLKTRIQLLLRSLNRAALTDKDVINRLLISEHDLLAKALEKLQLPYR